MSKDIICNAKLPNPHDLQVSILPGEHYIARLEDMVPRVYTVVGYGGIDKSMSDNPGTITLAYFHLELWHLTETTIQDLSIRHLASTSLEGVSFSSYVSASYKHGQPIINESGFPLLPLGIEFQGGRDVAYFQVCAEYRYDHWEKIRLNGAKVAGLATGMPQIGWSKSILRLLTDGA